MEHFKRSGMYFGRMLAVSLLVHLAFFLLLLSPRHGNFPAKSVAYFDLSMTEPVAKTIQAKDAAHNAKPAAEQTDPLPETPLQPAPTEFDKLQQGAHKALETAGAKPEAIGQASLALGITNGYFSSLAEGQSLHSDIKDYYFSLLRTVNEKWWVANDGRAGTLRRAMINVVIGRDGNVLKAQIMQGSGNIAYDRSLLKALEAASPFPPLPAQYRMSFFEAPLIFNPPLNLMATGNKS